ncbi:MAG: hypothetical protein IT302_08500 [Dehalococcoidia bacterium]|nr:hypothetical protein [Dehalococcoidia bacterium]
MAALLYCLFGPVVTEVTVLPGSSERQVRSHGLLNDGFEPVVAGLLLMTVGILVAILVAAVVDTRHDGGWAKLLLWCSSSALLLGSTVAIMALGWLFLPSAMLAIAAAVASEVRTDTRPGSTEPGSTRIGQHLS